MKSQICKWTTNINMNYMNCICQIMSNLILSLSPRWPRWPSCGQLFWSSWAKRSRELRWELRWGQSIWAPEQQLHGICKRHMVTRQTHGHTSWLRDVQSFNLAAVVRVRSTSSAACSAACFCISEQIMDQWMYESCMNHDSDLTTAKIFICNSEVSLCPRSVRPGSQRVLTLDLTLSLSASKGVACGLWPGWWSCGMRNLWCAHVQVSLQPWHHRRKAGPLMYRGVLGRGFLCRACTVWSEALWHSGAAAEASWELCSTVQGLSDCVSQLFKLSKLWMKSADLTSDWRFSYSGWSFERMFVGSQQASLWPLPFRGSRHCRVASLCS